MSETAADQLVLEIRLRHVSTRQQRCSCCTGVCRICGASFPCHAIRAADVIEAALMRAAETGVPS